MGELNIKVSIGYSSTFYLMTAEELAEINKRLK